MLFALCHLTGDSPPAFRRPKIPRKLPAHRCAAVFDEQICGETMKKPQKILCVLSRLLKMYRRKSAVKNRQGFDSPCLIQWNICPSSETEPKFPERNISIGARQIGVLRGGGSSKEDHSGAQRGGSQGGEISLSPPSCASLELSSHKGRKRSS